MTISNLLYKLLIFFLYLVFYRSTHITFRILYSSALHFAPEIKQHHIILLSDKPDIEVYTLDFTPINQTQTATLLKLLFAQNVPGEVRLRYIQTNINNDETILRLWNEMNQVDEVKSYKLSKSVYNDVYNKRMKNIFTKAFQWAPYMNLYTHNCQHFSHYVKKIFG